MQRTKSKILSILLSLVMLLLLLPTTALAAGNYPIDVALYNNAKKLISLSDGQYLAANGDTEASLGYTDGTSYVARYDKSKGTLYLKDYHGVGSEGGIAAAGDLNIVVERDSSFTTTKTTTYALMGIQPSGKLNISGDGKLTVTANGDGTVYGIYASEGVTISAPLDVKVGKVTPSQNGPVYGIYTKDGEISLSGGEKAITATGGKSTVYGVYNAANTSTTSKINISGNLTVYLKNGKSNIGIYKGSGGTITLNDATVNIPGNFEFGIYNNNGNVDIKNHSDVTLYSGESGRYGIWAKYGGNLTIENSTVNISAEDYAAYLQNGGLTIKDSIVDLTLDKAFYRVVETANNAANKIDLSTSGSVTLTASGNQTGSMIGGTVSITTPGTKCVKGTYCDYGSSQNYDGEYDGSKTVLKFVHEDPASTANISVSYWPDPTVFDSAEEGYDYAQARNLTIDNKGEADTGELTITVVGKNPDAFTVSKKVIDNIPAGKSAMSTVSPATGLPAGNYTATLKISGKNVNTLSINVQFTVKGVTSSPIGDVNGDGTIDATDMQRIYAHISRENTFSNPAQGDVNGDRNVDATDMQRIYAHISRENPLS